MGEVLYRVFAYVKCGGRVRNGHFVHVCAFSRKMVVSVKEYKEPILWDEMVPPPYGIAFQDGKRGEFVRVLLTGSYHHPIYGVARGQNAEG